MTSDMQLGLHGMQNFDLYGRRPEENSIMLRVQDHPKVRNILQRRVKIRHEENLGFLKT